MPRTRLRFVLVLIPLALLLLHAMPRVSAQDAAKNTEWRTFGGNLASWRYSPLDQIDASNFNKLRVAWRLSSQNFGPEGNWQTTPLVVNGVLYTTIGNRRSVAAVNAATGELHWMHRYIQEGERAEGAPRPGSGKGLAYWTDGKGDERILYVTIGYQLVALDAKSGRTIPGFGRNGIVDLKQELDQKIDLVTGEIGLRSAPVVAGNVIIIGAAHESSPQSRTNVKGYVRGYDVRTGKRIWIFHTVPQPGEFGNETWENDSWSYTGNTGVWAQISVDEELGIVYLPVETPTNDYYGGHRHGNNLFDESLVAVNLHTGKRIWHQQLVHHGIWDWDLSCAPILVDITVDGRRIKAVAQPTKQAFLFVFDRQTGEPVWPIEERPVPQSDVPGEKTSPTQRFPTKPPAYDRQGLSEEQLIDFTPELRAEALKLLSQFKVGPIYTPPILASETPPRALLMMPSSDGGTNWAGGSFDPETGIAYIPSHTDARPVALAHDPKRADIDYVSGGPVEGGGGGGEGGGRAPAVQGIPIVKPPWARISAIDLNRGEIVWQVAHGETPDAVRNSPALKGLTIPRTGAGSRHMIMTTKTLVIGGERTFYQTPQGRGSRLRAYDKKTGENVGELFMAAPQTGGPMTYMINGKQYLVVAMGGANIPGELIAYTLP